MVKTPDDRIVDTFLPLFSWVIGQVLGKDWGAHLSCSLYPAPASLRRILLQDFGGVDKAALAELESSCRRRKIRREYKDRLSPFMQAEAKRCAPVRFSLDKVCADAKARGYEPNWAHPPKWCDLEREYESRTEEIVSDPEELEKVFPPAGLVCEDYSSLLAKRIGEGTNYGETLAGTIYELRHHSHSLEIGEIRRRHLAQEFVQMIGLEPEQPEGMNLGDMLNSILKLSQDEGKLKEIANMVVGSMLTKDFIGEGRSGPYSRLEKKSQHEADSGMPLDALASEDNELQRVEERLLIEGRLEELPAQQREDVKLLLLADKEGRDPREVCQENERKYETVQRNFERALKFLEAHNI